MIDDAEQQRLLNNAMQAIIPEGERPTRRELSPIVVIAFVWLVLVPALCVGVMWMSGAGRP